MIDAGDMDLTDPSQAGIYFVTSDDLNVIDDDARQGDAVVCRIDLDGCADKADLLQRFADAFDFPATFGHNWDALEDSLGDLSWLPANGYLLLVDHIDALRRSDEADCDTLFQILDENSRTWADVGVAFFSFIALADEAFEDRDNNDYLFDDDALDDDRMDDDDA